MTPDNLPDWLRPWLLDTRQMRAMSGISFRLGKQSDQVTISVVGRGHHSRRNLCTFARSFPEADTVAGRWRAETPITRWSRRRRRSDFRLSRSAPVESVRLGVSRSSSSIFKRPPY